MLSNIAIGALLILLTTAVHTEGMALSFRSIRNHAAIARWRLHLNRVFRVGRVDLMMYLVAIMEVLIWGAAYLAFDAIDGFEKAIYFSAVTFTTLGYGDVVLG
ncbi:MAG: ion channel [Desulfobacterales bacterium]